MEIQVVSLGLKMALQEHRKKLEKQHFCERWPVGFSWLPLQNIKLGLSWTINFYILLKGHEGPVAMVCNLHLRRCSDSLGGVQPEAWGGLQNLLLMVKSVLGRSWPVLGASEGSTPSVGRGHCGQMGLRSVQPWWLGWCVSCGWRVDLVPSELPSKS